MKTLPTILAATLLGASALCAQVVNDGAASTLANVTNTITGEVVVGTNDAFTLLTLSDNALLTNSANGVIGRNASARSNEVHLVSPSARWLMGGNLVVGSNGSFSTLVVSNGALVGNNQGLVGFLSSGSNNAVVVTGAGSVWSNRLFVYVGQQGPSNRVRVTEGGRVVSTTLDLGFTTAFASDNEVTVAGAISAWSNGGDMRVGNASSRNVLRVSNGGTVIADGIATVGSSTSASSNTAVVTDAGSRWLVGTNLFVGRQGAFNRLVISNGGAVFSGSGNLGNSTTSDDNLAVVTGVGSLWNNTNNLLVGVAGARNRLVVTNGGTVSGSNIVVGFDPNSSTGNRVTVDGATLRVASASGAGALDVRRGTNVLNAGLVDVDRLVLTNAAGVFEFNGGTLVTRGALVNNGPVGFSIGAAGPNPATWNVLAGANDHFLASHLVVGNSAPFNQLLVTNGALLANGLDAVIGLNSGANSNIAVVSGAGSRWQAIGSSFEVGFACSFNRLVITNGGSVASLYSEIGGGTDGNSNEVLVSGAGSSWTNLSELHVGGGGRDNRLVVSNGGTVFTAAEQSVGNDSAAVSNIVLVTDPGSRWLGNSSLDVGRRGSFNRLTISNGAVVADVDGFLGHEPGASNNVALVTGVGSLWSNSDGLLVGFQGGGNQLVVGNGGVVACDNGHLGYFASASNNVALVTDAGSVWSNRLDLNVGFDGSGNRLVVTNGGTVLADNLFVGFSSLSANNRVTVDGGTVRVTNVTRTGTLDLRRGSCFFNSGLIEVDNLTVTNTASPFDFNGGTLSVKNSRVRAAVAFEVGDGISPATLLLSGNGLHHFSGLGIFGSAEAGVRPNATVTGNGTIGGRLFFSTGSRLMPGTSVGKIVLSNSPGLQGTIFMEISGNSHGSGLTNDQIQVLEQLNYGGSLVVSNLGPDALAAGNSFKLFSAPSYGKAFTNLDLPPLGPGLNWTNKLLVDGSIEVIAVPAPGFASTSLSGTNVIFTGTNGTPNAPYAVLTATNVVLPLSNWVSIATNLFDAGGAFSFTNGIEPGIPQRFFRLRTP